MSMQAMVWALERAPDVPPQALGVLMGLANHADKNGRGAYAGQDLLAEYARKSDRQVRTDLARLEELGLIRRGDQSLVAHFRSDKRPVVWDLAMERERGSSGRKHTSGRKQTSGRSTQTEEFSEIPGQSFAAGSTLPAGSLLPAGSTASSDRKCASAKPVRNLFPPTEERESASGRETAPAPQPGDGLCSLPDDFSISDAMRRWANSTYPHVDVAHETDQFISHYRATGDRRKSWPDQWQKWVRSAEKHRTERLSRAAPLGRTAAASGRSTTDERVAAAQALKHQPPNGTGQRHPLMTITGEIER